MHGHAHDHPYSFEGEVDDQRHLRQRRIYLQDYRQPRPADGKKYPVILLVHGNFGLGPPYGEQIQSFARDLAGLGY